MTTDTLSGAFAYYAANGAALFPIPAGQKNPTGIVESFVTDCSPDPAQWAIWRAAHPGCNFGLVAGASNLIIVDIDAKDDANAAWAAWCELCASWGVAVFNPQVRSARGGWHVLFKVPPGSYRQPDAVKHLINVRAGNGFVVAAGSHYDGLPYVLFPDAAAPYPAPAALIAHCTRSATTPDATAKPVGTADPEHVTALVKWLGERDAFDAYEDWLHVGMALKVELGDAGFAIWELTFDDKPDTPHLAESKWRGFASEPGPQSVTLGTFLKRARDMGFTGAVQKSLDAMFGSAVAALAAGAGATLAGAVPMADGQAVLCDLCAPFLDEFMNATATEPDKPLGHDFPTLPDTLAGHGLYAPVRAALARIFAMAERKPATLRNLDKRTVEPMAALYAMESTRTTYETVKRRLRLLKIELPEKEIIPRASAHESKVQRSQRTGKSWVMNTKSNEPENNNPDNVEVLLNTLSLSVRWNAWLDQMEIQGGRETGLTWPEWTRVDDPVVGALITRASETGTRFCPSDTLMWRTLTTFAKLNTVDPVVDELRHLESAWDGLPRLNLWLAAAMHVPNNAYLSAVGCNIVGGMVRRIRKPGSKHDTMAIFYGPQGTFKSTMAMVVADMGASTLPQLIEQGTPRFSDAVKLGDEAKDLVQMLRGKTLVEFSEMGMRGNANVDHVKAMLSHQVDEGREPYARAPTQRARRNIFLGTTNNNEPLTDPTGNRRFLPVRVDRNIDVVWLSATIGQIVGEACARESKGEAFLIPAEVETHANEAREEARSASSVETLFDEWFKAGEYSENAIISGKELDELCRAAGLDKVATGHKSQHMHALGFLHLRHGNRRLWHWIRGDRSKAVEYRWNKSPEGRVTVVIRQGGIATP